MSPSARFTVFGFETTHDALRAERVLEEASVEAVLIPTPKALGALCGLAARVPVACADAAADVLAASDVRVSGSVEFEDRTSA